LNSSQDTAEPMAFIGQMPKFKYKNILATSSTQFYMLQLNSMEVCDNG